MSLLFCPMYYVSLLIINDMIVVLLLLKFLAFTDNDSKVNGSFKINGAYKENYGDLGNDEAKAYMRLLTTEVGIFDFYHFGPLLQHYLKVPQF